MNETILRRFAKPMLVITPFIWGVAFVGMKNSLDSFTPFYLLAFRFSLAAILLGLVCWKTWKLLDRQYIKVGALLGTLLFLSYSIQTFGLERTTPGKNAFLTAIYCVIVPFLHWAVSKRRPDRYNVAAAFLCIVGIGMVALSSPGEGGALNVGDGLTLICGFFFAAHMVAVERCAKALNTFLITTLQFAFFGLWSWVCAFLTREPFPTDVPLEGWMGIVALEVLASDVGLLFQNIGQKYVPPATAAVLLSLEAPFGVLASVVMGTEDLTVVMSLGFVVIFLGVICSETKFSFLHKKKAEVQSR